MNRNRAEVSTRWSAAGAASLCNLRLPPKASGNATGAGPAPGFMRLTPDSRALAKADPAARAGVVVVAVVVVAVVVVVVVVVVMSTQVAHSLADVGPILAYVVPILALGRPM